MIVVVFAAVLGGILFWMGWVWRRTSAPAWAGLIALVLAVLGASCVVAMAAAFISQYRVPETLTTAEQSRQVAMHGARLMRWGMRFWGAALVSAGWLLFVGTRWEAGDRHPRG